MIWHQALVYVCNIVLADLSDDEGRFYFDICVHSYGKLCTSFRAARPIIKGLLALAVRARLLSIEEARDILETTGEEDEIHATGIEWMLDLHKERSVSALAQDFDDMTIFDAFIQVNQDD